MSVAAAPGGSGDGNGGGDKKWKVPESLPDLLEEEMEEDDEELLNLDPLKQALPTKEEMGRRERWLKVKKSGGRLCQDFIKKRKLHHKKRFLDPKNRVKELATFSRGSSMPPPPPSDGDDDDDEDSKGSDSNKTNK